MSAAEIRTVQLSILDQLDSYCRTHQVRYHLAFGTLLGAVRHSGYIPWDDDIDVSMPRPDYERFCAITALQPIGKSIMVGCIDHEPSWPFVYAKVMSTTTRLVDKSDLDVSLGVYVDIFPVDGLPSNRLAVWIQERTLRLFRAVMMAQAISRDPTRPLMRRILLGITKTLVAPASRHWLAQQRIRVATRYPFAGSNGVGLYSGEVFVRTERRYFDESVEVAFEGRSLPAPANPRTVLTAIYGDYARLPPPEQRVSHHAWAAYAVTASGCTPNDRRHRAP